MGNCYHFLVVLYIFTIWVPGSAGRDPRVDTEYIRQPILFETHVVRRLGLKLNVDLRSVRQLFYLLAYLPSEGKMNTYVGWFNVVD